MIDTETGGKTVVTSFPARMVRLPQLQLPDMSTWWRASTRHRWLVTLLLIGVAAVLAGSLLLPGRTFSGQHSWDMMVWADGAYRVAHGQVPNRDFHTPFGLVGHALLGWAYLLSPRLGALMPVNAALYALLLLPLLLYTSLSRLPWPVAIVFGCHLLVLVISPANLGDVFPAPTFGMFYNRLGWALLSLLALFVLPRAAGFGSARADAVVMAVTWCVMFYLKLSFAAVGGVVLLACLAFRHVRGPAIAAMAVCALVLVVVEAFWRHTLAYFADIAAAGVVSGAVQGGVAGLGVSLLANLVGFELFALIGLLALWRGVRLDYLLVALMVGGAGVFVANQNSQGAGIPTLAPAALILLLAPRREGEGESGPLLPIGLLLTAALFVPADLFALACHAKEVARAARAPAGGGDSVALDGLLGPLVPAAAPGVDPAREACAMYDHGPRDLLTPVAAPEPSQGEYLATVLDGAQLLRRDPALGGTVITLDFANPFDAVLGRAPVVGGNHWNQFGRNFDLRTHLAPDQAFGNATVIMVPRRPAQPETLNNLGKLFGPYIATQFTLAGRSACWDAYRRRGG